MEVIGSVAPDEVPEGERRMGRRSKWAVLADQILADYDQRRVTVVKVADNKELNTMRTSLATKLRPHGKKLRPVIVRQGGELRVFCELALRDEPEKNGTA